MLEIQIYKKLAEFDLDISFSSEPQQHEEALSALQDPCRKV